MAQWASANLRMLLPSGATAILDAIEAILPVVQTPLDVVSSILDTAKNTVIAFNLFDFLGIIRGMIEDFKNSILGTGFYSCTMWDYPARQLTGALTGYSSTGPDNTFGAINLYGNRFEDSFLADLNNSFDDTMDPFRPQFVGSCAMIVLVRSAATPEMLGLSVEEDNVSDAWMGMGSIIKSSSRCIRTARMRKMLSVMKEAAQLQPLDKVDIRVQRVEQAIQSFNSMSVDEMDAVIYHENEETGDLYCDNATPSELSWKDDILPIIESIEAQRTTSSYPDWGQIAIRDIIPNLTEIVNYIFDPVLDLLQSGTTLKQVLIDLIDAIKSKVETLQNIIDSIDIVLEEIDRLLSATGYHAIYVSSNDGVSGLRSKLMSATNIPFEGEAFYCGMAIVAGSDSKAVFDTIFSTVAS